MNENQPGVQLIESEEDKKKKGQATQPGSAFAPTGPSAPSAPSGTQQARAAQAAGPTRGTGFTGVGRFLQANVGSRLGQEVAGRVSQAGQQAASRLGQAAGQFQQQLGQKQQELSAQQQAAQAALQRIAGGVEQPQPEIKDGGQKRQITVWGVVKPPSERFGTGFSGSLADKYNKWQSQIKREDMPSEEEFLSSLSPDEALQYKSKFPEGMSGSRKNLYREQLSKITQPVSLTPSEQDIAAYQAIAGGQIQAPTGLQDVEDVRAQAALAGKLAKGTQTTAGRTGLLQQVVGRGPRQYTAGQSALDALILGQAGGQLAAARRASAGLGRQVETQSRLAEERAREFGSEARRAKEALTGERGAELSKLAALGEKQRGEFEAAQSEFYNTALKEIEEGVLSPETATRLFGDVKDVDLYGYTKQEVKNLLEKGIQPTYESSLSEQQAAAINALKKLAGETAAFTPEQLKDIIGKTALVSPTKSPGVVFDPEGKIKQKSEAFSKEKQTIDDVIDWFKKTGSPGIANQLRAVSYGDIDTDLFGSQAIKSRGFDIRNPMGADYGEFFADLYGRGSETAEKIKSAVNAMQNIRNLRVSGGDILKVKPKSGG